MGEAIDAVGLEEILSRHPRNETSAIAVLQDIQERYHYLPREAFPRVAEALGIGEARLYGIATFYENFSLDPKGAHIIRCCDGTACHVRGSSPVLARFREEAGLAPGQTTTDDLLFTVETVSCLGACGLAPAITVDGEVHAAMTPERAAEIIAVLREQAEGDASDATEGQSADAPVDAPEGEAATAAGPDAAQGAPAAPNPPKGA